MTSSVRFPHETHDLLTDVGDAIDYSSDDVQQGREYSSKLEIQRLRVMDATESVSQMAVDNYDIHNWDNSRQKYGGGNTRVCASTNPGAGDMTGGGHRLVTIAQATKYPSAKWIPKKASFYDSETLTEKLNLIEVERGELLKEERELTLRYDDSRDKVERLLVKKTSLVNRKEIKDFKVDINVGAGGNNNNTGSTYNGVQEDGRDGWLKVKPPPENDLLARQLHTLELKLLNKEILKGMSALENQAKELERDANAVVNKLESLKNKLDSFPQKVMLNVEEVQKLSIELVDEKGNLEKERDKLKRQTLTKCSNARTASSKKREVVNELSEELATIREDLKYWSSRLKFESVKIEPDVKELKRLKGELEKGKKEGEGGWYYQVVKSAFLQGCNMDMVVDEADKINDQAKTRNRGISNISSEIDKLTYNNVEDKIYLRRIPEVLRRKVYPSILNIKLIDVKTICEKNDIFFDDEENFGTTKVGFDEFYSIVKGLTKLVEMTEESGGEKRLPFLDE